MHLIQAHQNGDGSLCFGPLLATPCILLDILVSQCPRYHQSREEHLGGQEELFRKAFFVVTIRTT